MSGDTRSERAAYLQAMSALLLYTVRHHRLRAIGTVVLVVAAAAANTAVLVFSVRLLTLLGHTRQLLVAVLLLGLAVVFAEAVTAASSALAADLGVAVEGRLRQGLIRHTAARAGHAPAGVTAIVDGGYPPDTVLTCLASIATRVLTALGAIALLSLYSWWAPLLILCTHLIGRRQARALFTAAVSSTIDERQTLARAGYLVDLALEPATAKEWRLFGLQRHVIAELGREWRRLLAVVVVRRRRMMRAALLSNVLVAVSVAAVLLPLAWSTAHGQVSVARFVLMIQALLAARGIASFSGADYAVATALPGLRLAIATAGPTGAPAVAAAPAVELPSQRHSSTGAAPRLDFVRVAFSYPGAGQPALDDLSLEIPAGQVTAVVGANGAGKTTLVKLLQGIEGPDRGQVLVDGADLGDLDLTAWRHRIAVVRQDFARYPLTVADNVSVGVDPDPALVAEVLELAGLDEAIAALPDGTQTLLSAGQDDGAELSGGQWQRIALARAAYAVRRGAQLVLLDEPTASLDPRTELETFQRLLDFVAGTTTVLISHRFAAVRLAAKIVVLDGGRVVEQGTHGELLAAGGWYAHAFRTQADRYQAVESR